MGYRVQPLPTREGKRWCAQGQTNGVWECHCSTGSWQHYTTPARAKREADELARLDQVVANVQALWPTRVSRSL
jgi:hypothetical protein